MAAVPIFTLPALRRARDLIDLCYAEPLNLDDLAREAGYSKYHFARAFLLPRTAGPHAYTEPRTRRVTFLKELADRPYGIEALFQDDSGNWFSLTQSKYEAAKNG